MAKAELLELFDQTPNLREAVIFVESAPLSGIRVVYVWEEFPESGRMAIHKVNFRTKTEKTTVERTLAKTAVADLLKQLETIGSPLGNYSGGAKDGVYYSLCWGCPSKMSLLSINNPQVGSKPHQEFVKMIKLFAE